MSLERTMGLFLCFSVLRRFHREWVNDERLVNGHGSTEQMTTELVASVVEMLVG